MVMDSNRAWNKADTPSKAIHAEIELRELIKVVVDKHMAPKLAGKHKIVHTKPNGKKLNVRPLLRPGKNGRHTSDTISFPS